MSEALRCPTCGSAAVTDLQHRLIMLREGRDAARRALITKLKMEKERLDAEIALRFYKAFEVSGSFKSLDAEWVTSKSAR
jgi:hypothetical protein